MKTAIQLDLTYEQVLLLVKQLTQKQKIELSKELEKEFVGTKLSKLLSTFKTNELTLDEINKEVETVRAELYEKQKN